MDNLRGGTSVFLFTDIEGSTRMWERDPDRMQRALAHHDRIMRGAIEANGGQVFKTVGDAFCAVFQDAANAVRASIEAQLELEHAEWETEGPLRARIALHTGAAEIRDGDYFGPSLNRVARLLSTGSGGQVLLTESTFGLVKDSLAAGATLRFLGEYRLKDLLAPERVWQVCHAELDQEFPRLKTLDYLPTNLPQQVTSFIGRELEIGEVKRLLEGSRLVTLTGSGGTGKSRLSLQAGAELLDSYPDGVWLIELAPVSDPSLVVQTLAAVLNVREEPGRPLIVTLVEVLQEKRLLIILDNCEHLLTAVASLADTLLKRCARITLLASSREALKTQGEQAYRVPSLSMPDRGDALRRDGLSNYEATRLFVDRAASAQVSFVPSDAEAPAIASICRRLDGIPLAIELAAARVRSLSIPEIHDRLDNAFRLLTGGSRAALPRQQTLRALVDWSYELLDAKEKSLFARLAVFAGEWSMEAVEAVCTDAPDHDAIEAGSLERAQRSRSTGDSAVRDTTPEAVGGSIRQDCALLEEWEILDLLTALVDKSLVVFETAPSGDGRYRMMETVRQYAAEKLTSLGIGHRVRLRHLRYYLEFAERAEPEILTADQARWIERLEGQHGNLRSAVEFCARFAEMLDLELRLVGCLTRFWFFSSYLEEGRSRIAAALGRVDRNVSSAAYAKALNGLGVICYFQGDLGAAQTACQRCLEPARAAGDWWSQGVARIILGVLGSLDGRFEFAGENFGVCYALARHASDVWLEALALSNLGFVALHMGDFDAAIDKCEGAIGLARQVGEKWCVFNALYSLGLVRIAAGDFIDARALFKEAMSISLSLGHKISVALCMDGLAGAWGGRRAKRNRPPCYWEPRLLGAKRSAWRCRRPFASAMTATSQPCAQPSARTALRRNGLSARRWASSRRSNSPSRSSGAGRREPDQCRAERRGAPAARQTSKFAALFAPNGAIASPARATPLPPTANACGTARVRWPPGPAVQSRGASGRAQAPSTQRSARP